ncbi:MAG TPA: oligosaccharide flippase family protein [Blastocatellia bacterium]|nr:oligosaccharide flippase family protein [Blastocatellia bacterium]
MRESRTKRDPVWGREFSQLEVFAKNISMNYIALGVDMLIGVVMLPFNVAHLGQSTYGLWVLVASITMYFSMLDLGYAVAQVKFAAEYRARRDHAGLNEIISTLFFFFSIIGLAAFALGCALAFNLERFFNVTVEQADTGRSVLMIISAYIALGFPASVFGGVVNGFQRNYINGFVSISTSVIVAAVNIAVLMAGYGLVELVAATTTVRALSYFAYAMNAYRAYPGLRIRPSNVRLARLKEVTGFSAFILVIDLANKLNYSTDAMVIGAFMSTAAIAVWAVAQRLIDATQTITGNLNGVLFPIVVDTATLGETQRLRQLFIQGTRISLAMVIPIATGLILLAEPLVNAWVGPDFARSVPVIYILALAVAIRVGNSTATTVLKGAGRHRLLAAANISMALANVALSIALVHRLELIGVALGTLAALATVSFFVLFPAACRRVELSIRVSIAAAVWPAIWPALVMAFFLAITRNLASANLVAIALQAILAGIIYLAVFLTLAIDRAEREWYFAKARQLVKRPSEAAAV